MGESQAHINKELSNLTPDTLIELFEIDFSNLQTNFEMLDDLYGVNLGAEPVYRFCAMINGANPLIWQGKAYQALPIKMEGFEQKSDGRLPRPTMTLANPEGIFSKIIRSNNDFANCRVTRRRTYVKFLDEENFQNRNNPNQTSLNLNPFGKSDPGSHLPDDLYFINKKTQENKVYIEFELVSSLEIENSPVPARVVLSDYCGWTYRCNIGCGYKGLPIETIDKKSLLSGFSKNKNGEVDPAIYPGGALDIPEWSRYGNSGTASNQKGYALGDLVKIIAKTSTDPYKKIPQVFVCSQSHSSAKEYHPFFNKDFWLKDECQKNLSSCQKRFDSRKQEFLNHNGAKNSPGLPFGGFPGTEKFNFE